jgi:hypothetical protein
MLCPAATVPSGALVEIRLRAPIDSRTAQSGDTILADVIAPVVQDNNVVVPFHSTLRGRITSVGAIGKGLRRQRASIGIVFDTVEFPDGSTRTVPVRLKAVDNARETVDENGVILGIKPRSPMGHRLAGITRNLFIWDPLIQVVLAASTMATLRFPEAEIHLPAGTELWVEVTESIELRDAWPQSMPSITSTPEERSALAALVRAMSVKTSKAGSGKPADIVNLLLLGDENWIRLALARAGWIEADSLSAATGWKSFRSLAESSPYPAAPMSAQLLDERPSRGEFSKALNSSSKRHHVRFFDEGAAWRGLQLHPASATQDLATTFSFSRLRIIHAIDRAIDNERAKLVNDLIQTGCVDAAELIERPWVPARSLNGTGETVTTDGAIAVLELNPCRAAEANSPAAFIAARHSAPKMSPLSKGLREFVLSVGQDFTDNNPVKQAYEGVRFLVRRVNGSEKRDRVQPARTSNVTRSAFTY